MACRQLTVDVPEEIKDIVIAELSEHSASGFWESGEPAPGTSRIEAYFDPACDLENVVCQLREIFASAGLAPSHLKIGDVADFDWLSEWKKSWVSFPLGSKFFVIPSWSEDFCPSDRFPIHMDPGQAFGTGTHETTQLTLEALESLAADSNTTAQVLDLGTGSGVLAIAAGYLGFPKVQGCDIDWDSVLVAQENLERNSSAGSVIGLFCGSIDAIRTSSIDVLLCNLTADVIHHLFDEICRAVRDGGMAILSGILSEQRVSVRGVFENAGWIVESDSQRGEWIALVMRKSRTI